MEHECLSQSLLNFLFLLCTLWVGRWFEVAFLVPHSEGLSAYRGTRSLFLSGRDFRQVFHVVLFILITLGFCLRSYFEGFAPFLHITCTYLTQTFHFKTKIIELLAFLRSEIANALDAVLVLQEVDDIGNLSRSKEVTYNISRTILENLGDDLVQHRTQTLLEEVFVLLFF